MDKPFVTTLNEFGLVAGQTYIFKDEGRRVDWRAMIPAEYLVPNKQNFEKRGEKIPQDIKGIADKDLLILLDGIKYVADLRGFESVTYNFNSSPEHCTASCTIVWSPNFETRNQAKTFTGMGDANFSNTNGFGSKFLGPIAENRAFVRAVRNFLRIPILGKDEVDGVTAQEPTEDRSINQEIAKMQKELSNLMATNSINFETIKNKLVEEGVPQAESFTSVEDFPKAILISLVQRLQKVKKVKAKTKVSA